MKNSDRVCWKTSWGLFAVFFLCWIVPIHLLLFIRDVPFAGRYLNYQFRISRLFTHRVSSWSNFYVQYKSATEAAWKTVPLDAFSQMDVYGYGTRLQRIVNDSLRSRDRGGGSSIRRKLGLFIKEEIERLHPEEGAITELRIVRVAYPTGSPKMKKPAGKWTVEKFEATPAEVRKVVSHLVFSEDGAE